MEKLKFEKKMILFIFVWKFEVFRSFGRPENSYNELSWNLFETSFFCQLTTDSWVLVRRISKGGLVEKNWDWSSRKWLTYCTWTNQISFGSKEQTSWCIVWQFWYTKSNQDLGSWGSVPGRDYKTYLKKNHNQRFYLISLAFAQTKHVNATVFKLKKIGGK